MDKILHVKVSNVRMTVAQQVAGQLFGSIVVYMFGKVPESQKMYTQKKM